MSSALDYQDDERAPVYPGGLLDPEERVPYVPYTKATRPWNGWTPSLATALAEIDGYGWHPLYEYAHEAIEKTYEKFGGLEAMARASELRDLFRAMCDPSPWEWLG